MMVIEADKNGLLYPHLSLSTNWKKCIMYNIKLSVGNADTSNVTREQSDVV